MSPRFRALSCAAGAMLVAASAMAAGRPPVPQTGAAIEAFVPSGYTIETRIERDLEGQGRRDAALLIVPACENVPAPETPDECRSEGRKLVVVFKTAQGYRLSIDVAIDSGYGVHGDTFAGLQVQGRTLSLAGGSSSCAGASGGDRKALYRYQDGDWFLIGVEERQWDRGCGSDAAGKRSSLSCPGIRLRADEACVEVRRSANFNAGSEEVRTLIGSREEESEDAKRTVVARHKLAKAPLTRLADSDLSF